MSETRIAEIIEFLDKSSRVKNQNIRLRMTALQFGIRHSANKPDALQNRVRLSNRLRTCNIQTMKASDCVIPPQLRSIHGLTVGIEQLDFHTHRTHVKFPKQDITSSVQLLALSHDIFIIIATIT